MGLIFFPRNLSFSRLPSPHTIPITTSNPKQYTYRITKTTQQLLHTVVFFTRKARKTHNFSRNPSEPRASSSPFSYPLVRNVLEFSRFYNLLTTLSFIRNRTALLYNPLLDLVLLPAVLKLIPSKKNLNFKLELQIEFPPIISLFSFYKSSLVFSLKEDFFLKIRRHFQVGDFREKFSFAGNSSLEEI